MPVPEPKPVAEFTAMVSAVCHAPFDAAWTALDERLTETLTESIGVARLTHREIVDDLGLGGPAPSEAQELSRRLVEYRRRVGADVLIELLESCERNAPTETIAGVFAAAFEEASAGCRALPVEVATTWPARALDPRSSDGLGRRIGKSFARWVSVARRPGHERTAPARAVAERHLGRDVVPGQDSEAAVAMRAWASWMRSLEVAWTEWGDAALPVLMRAEAPPEGGTEEPWSVVAASASRLEGRLDELSQNPAHRASEARGRGRLVDALGVLDADLAVAGSFLFSPKPGAAPIASLKRVLRAASGLGQWDQGVAARLRLYSSLMAILAGASAVQDRLTFRLKEHCLAPLEQFPEIADGLTVAARDLVATQNVAGLGERLSALRARLDTTLVAAGEALPDAARDRAVVNERADASVEALLSIVRQVPQTLLLHAPGARVPSGVRQTETRSLGLQELARQSFDSLRIERIRSSAFGVLQAVDRVRADAAELPNVLTFAFDAAATELEEGEDGAEQRAVELVKEALESVADALRVAPVSLETEISEVRVLLAGEVCEGSAALFDRVGAGRMQAQLFAAQSRAADARAWVNDTWGPPVDRAFQSLVRVWTHTRGLITRGVRRGTEIVGADIADRESSTRTLRTLASADALSEGLPLVYQRLFTLDPLSEGALLAGRDGELADGLARWQRSRSGEGIPLLVRGRQGSGVTSFLNVLGEGISDSGATLVRLPFEARITTETELADVLAPALGLEPVDSIDRLAEAILRAPDGGVPEAVTLDNLEHLYLRVPGGTDLIERLLTMMAETEARIFWTAGITASAWQLIAKIEPTAASQVDGLDLRPLGAEHVQAAMTLRHRRSGLQVRYGELAAGRHHFRSWVARLDSSEHRRERAERSFFDRLERASHGTLRLALFQWLRAADFGTGDGVLMGPVERPDFSILGGLDLTQNFTLKAFLEHRTLTLGEHDAIFRLPRQESFQIFEALGNRDLIEAVDGEEDRPTRSEIVEGLRYRVRPLLAGAIIRHLESRNIVH